MDAEMMLLHGNLRHVFKNSSGDEREKKIEKVMILWHEMNLHLKTQQA